MRSLSRLLALMLAVSLMVAVMPAEQAFAPPTAEYWVSHSTGSNSNPGTESEPFATITMALQVAGPGETVYVKPGDYSYEPATLQMAGERLIGVGGASVTSIPGVGGRVINATSESAGVVISGFTIRLGGVSLNLNAPNSGYAAVIEDCVFVSNSATDGGAIYAVPSGAAGERRVAIQRNEFVSNSATNGGAIRLDNGVLGADIEENLFEGNVAQTGGAILVTSFDRSVNLRDNVFVDNMAMSGSGGALYSSGSGLTHAITGNEFRGNYAWGAGGALWLYGATVTLSGNDVGGSQSGSGGGGFAFAQYCSIVSENNVVGGCTSGGFGGAWHLDTAGLTLRNDTIVENGNPSGAAVFASPDAGLTVVNSILWNPAAAWDVMGADSLSYSCVYDTDVANPAKGNNLGPGVIHTDPKFVDLPAHDARLDTGSPCIDTANAADAPATDFYGTVRPYDGDRDGIAKPDMGYHEYVPPIQHDAAGVTFDRFVTGYNVAYSGGGYVYGRWTGTKLQARFTGSKVRWIGPKQPSYGKADVYVDGVKAATVDCYASAAEKTTSAVLWESATLTDATHTLEIRLVGQKNAASSGYVVVLDRFEVDGAAPAGGGVRHDEKSGTLSGPWIYGANSAYIAKGYNYSRYTNATFTKSFTGTRVAWIGPKTPGYGRAKVYIDNKLIGTVSQYGPTGWRYKVWESASLPYGNHTIKIVPTATKDAASKGTIIVIDAIDVR